MQIAFDDPLRAVDGRDMRPIRAAARGAGQRQPRLPRRCDSHNRGGMATRNPGSAFRPSRTQPDQRKPIPPSRQENPGTVEPRPHAAVLTAYSRSEAAVSGGAGHRRAGRWPGAWRFGRASRPVPGQVDDAAHGASAVAAIEGEDSRIQRRCPGRRNAVMAGASSSGSEPGPGTSAGGALSGVSSRQRTVAGLGPRAGRGRSGRSRLGHGLVPVSGGRLESRTTRRNDVNSWRGARGCSCRWDCSSSRSRARSASAGRSGATELSGGVV